MITFVNEINFQIHIQKSQSCPYSIGLKPRIRQVTHTHLEFGSLFDYIMAKKATARMRIQYVCVHNSITTRRSMRSDCSDIAARPYALFEHLDACMHELLRVWCWVRS